MATSGWAEDDLSTLHGLTTNAFYVKDDSKDMTREYPNYDCGLQKEYGTFDEIIQTSKKRYLYKGVGFMGRASGKNKSFYCGFNDKSEALIAIDTILLTCIKAGFGDCHLGGTGDKTGNYYMSGAPIRSDLLMKQRIAILQNQNATEKRRQEIANYIRTKRELCIAYGYEGVNVIAECVEREINKDTVRQNQIAQGNYQIQQRNNQRQRDAISQIGRALILSGSGQTQTTICNFKNFDGMIIQGDCKQNSITQGNDVYGKIK